MNRILIAGEKSGCGKTTVVCGILSVLKDRGIRPACVKCGPDYIDPMFHRRITGVKSSNIDLFFTDGSIARSLIKENSKDTDMTVIEGVMGYYDGLGGKSDIASGYHTARVTKTPVILVIDAKGSSLSMCAKINGFINFRSDSGIAGVILNRCSSIYYDVISECIESECGIKALGYMEDDERLFLKSRKLGLVTPMENVDMKEWLKDVAEMTERCIDIEAVVEISKSAEEIKAGEIKIEKSAHNAPRLAIAFDDSFCFYYDENLNVLEKAGFEIVTFSPLSDKVLPKDVDALYIGGGYPELFSDKLCENTSMKESIKNAVNAGMPTIAECGGFMYLCDSIESACDSTSHKMAGAIPGSCYDTGKLTRFGYITLKALKDNLLCEKGDVIRAHEFHYFDSTNNGNDFTAKKSTGNSSWECINASDTLFAGFPHIYFYSNLKFVQRFARAASKFRSEKNGF